MKKIYDISYLDENDFKMKERGIKKYNMLAYKKLYFDYYPSIKEGIFMGNIISKDSENNIIKYELDLPTDNYFKKVHGQIELYYTVYENENRIVYETLEPSDMLDEMYKYELYTYKGILISKSHGEIDKFKIDLLNNITRD